MQHVHKMGVITLVAFVVALVMFGFTNFIMYYLARRYQKSASYLHVSLIKYKESIQQAERKSMNKSSAFTSACHDIRTSLAGISGLIDLCCCDTNNNSYSTCNLPIYNVNGTPYKFDCIAVNITGNPLVLLVGFPYKDIMQHVHKMGVITIVAFIVALLMFGFTNFIMYRLARRYQKSASYLRASLIKYKESIQQAERKCMKKSLAFASASHDIRTSLVGISGLIDLCYSHVPPSHDLCTYLGHMSTCASQLLAIVNSILDTSKVEAGKMQLEEIEFDMAKVVEESVDIFQIVASKKGLELIWDPCDFSIFRFYNVKGDYQIFRQILDNLLSNAVKFTLQGHIVLRAWAKKRYSRCLDIPSDNKCQVPDIWNPIRKMFDENVAIYDEPPPFNDEINCIEFIFEVEDSGIGIPKEKKEAIFENYVQVNESISNGKVVGTGLGLGIVQSYVRLMGGEIDLLDKDINAVGACFRFNIFLKQAEQSSQIKNDRFLSFDSQPDKLHGVNVLHLVQGVQTRKILGRWMKSFGAKVWEADGLESLSFSLENLKCELDGAHFLHIEKFDPIHLESLSSISNGQDIKTTSSINDVHQFNNSIKRTVTTDSGAHILIIVDMSFEPLSDLFAILRNFTKNISKTLYKIVCLRDSNVPLAKLKTPMCEDVLFDLILEKPFHGSRIYDVLSLFQESESFSLMENRLTDSSRLLPYEEDVASNNMKVYEKPLAGWHILIVEDNRLMCHLASSMISRLGASTHIAENGEIALNLIREALKELDGDDDRSHGQMLQKSKRFLYDLILMDCKMPKMNGYETTKQIRLEEKHYNLHIPIVALSADEESENCCMAVDSGMDLHVVKPLSKELLLNAIQTLNLSTSNNLYK